MSASQDRLVGEIVEGIFFLPCYCREYEAAVIVIVAGIRDVGCCCEKSRFTDNLVLGGRRLSGQEWQLAPKLVDRMFVGTCLHVLWVYGQGMTSLKHSQYTGVQPIQPLNTQAMGPDLVRTAKSSCHPQVGVCCYTNNLMS